MMSKKTVALSAVSLGNGPHPSDFDKAGESNGSDETKNRYGDPDDILGLIKYWLLVG